MEKRNQGLNIECTLLLFLNLHILHSKFKYFHIFNVTSFDL